MKESFGEYIRKLRNQKGFTLTQLAAKIDMDSANLSKIETGRREFDRKKLEKLSQALDIDLSILKDEYYSEFVAKKLYENDCSERVLALAEEKVNYLKAKNYRQTEINF